MTMMMMGKETRDREKRRERERRERAKNHCSFVSNVIFTKSCKKTCPWLSRH